MRAAIYIRVSSIDQAASGLGLEAQLSRCREYCIFRGFDVVAEIVDDGDGRGQSASKPLTRRDG